MHARKTFAAKSYTLDPLIKGDLLGRSGHTLLVEGPVRRMRRLLDGRAPLVQPGRDDRIRVLEEADKLPGKGLVGFGEERDRLAGAAGATCSTDTVNVLNRLRGRVGQYDARGTG